MRTQPDRGTPPPIAESARLRDGARAVETAFRRSLRRATLIPIVLLTLGSFLLAGLVIALRGAHAWIDHTDVVIGRANQIEKLTMEREDALRGYLLSHERVFLDQFNRADLQLSPLFDELQERVSDNPDQVEVLRSARVEVIRARHHAAQQVDRVMAGEPVAAIARHVDEGTVITQRILGRLESFIAAEQGLRPGRVHRADVLATYAVIIGTVLGLAIGGGIALATASHMRLIRKRYVELLDQQERTERALAEANARLRDADRRKDEFLSLLSHELRAPLAPIRNSVQVLTRAEPNSERSQRARAIIERQVVHLTRLVDDLLDLRRISAGKMRLQPARLDLVARVREVVEDLRAVFVEKRVRLDLHAPGDPVWIDADAIRVAQVVGNLLQNAAKFTDPGGAVSVMVEASDTAAHVRVRDTGVGIAPELLETLFEPFVQGSETLDRSRGGLGLGLALVRGIVELHGGTVAARSEPGRGAEFEVVLPRAPTAPSADRRKTPLRVPLARRRILVIEDNVDAAESLRDLLEVVGGHDVSVSRDGAEAVNAARRLRPDVILCDLGLPSLDGYEVARQLRSGSEPTSATLVAISGYASPDDIARSRCAGFDHHLSKPPELGRLLRIVAGDDAIQGSGGADAALTPRAERGKPGGWPA